MLFVNILIRLFFSYFIQSMNGIEIDEKTVLKSITDYMLDIR